MSTIDKIKQERLKKRKALKDLGDNPYPVSIQKTHTTVKVLDDFSGLLKNKKRVKLAGRLMSFRTHGAISFGNLKDSSGQIQLAFRSDGLGKTAYGEISKFLDVGDFLSVEGTLFKTKKGEKTLDVVKYKIISKSLRPLPEKWHGLKDVEQRYRKRYLDLLMNEDVKHLFETRSQIIGELRKFLDNESFTEVETPVLQQIPGGASAKPFKTHLNAFKLDMYLRISLELYLKRLIVGGFDKVYEMGRNFRNEGVDFAHNPEFTMVEFYWAYSDYKEGMKFTEKLIRTLFKNVKGSLNHEYEGKRVDFKKEFERIEFNKLLQKYAGVKYEDYNFEALKEKAKDLGIEISKKIYSKAEVADAIYKKFCLPQVEKPTFVIHHPSEMLPLAKPLENAPQFAASFQFIVAGWELVKGYSELNDPVLQKEFFKAQQELRKKGDEEAQFMDEDFIEALEYGMPPTLGFGMGIDRLAAFMTGTHSLREIILFPTMRPK